MQTYALHQVDVASELLHSWWFAHAQSNNKTINVWLFMKHWICLHSLPVSLIKIEHLAFGLVFYFCQLNRTFVHTNPMLHAEPYINYYLLPTHMHHYNSLLLLHGWHQRHRWSRRGSDSELLRSQKNRLLSMLVTWGTYWNSLELGFTLHTQLPAWPRPLENSTHTSIPHTQPSSDSCMNSTCTQVTARRTCSQVYSHFDTYTCTFCNISRDRSLWMQATPLI